MPDSLMIWVSIAIYAAVVVFVMWPLILCLAVSWTMTALIVGVLAEIIWITFLVCLIPRRKRIPYGEMLTVGK